MTYVRHSRILLILSAYFTAVQNIFILKAKSHENNVDPVKSLSGHIQVSATNITKPKRPHNSQQPQKKVRKKQGSDLSVKR